MKRLLFAAILMLGAYGARADLPFAIPHHVLLNSDVVVSGVLTMTDLHVIGRREFNSANLHVVKVFAGPVLVGEDLQIHWENTTGVTCPRASYEKLKGKEAMWFFPYSGGHQYDANDEQHVKPLSIAILEDFLTSFSSRHGPPDTDLEKKVIAYVNERLDALLAK